MTTRVRKKWTESEVAELAREYPSRGLQWCAERFGVPASTIRTRANRMGLRVDHASEHFAEWQRRAAQTKVGRKRPDQALVMRRLHDEGKFPPKDRAAMSARAKAWHKANEHPRGMLGKKHTEATKQHLRLTGKSWWATVPEERRAEIAMRMARTVAAMGVPTHRHGSWRAAWREIGGQRKFFRSRWEANYARILQLWVQLGHVASWEHEPHTFWFEGIKRGCVSYLPDFRVTFADGRVEFHEVKGWMDDRSKTKIARMARYHPDVVLRVIDGKAYKELMAAYGGLIDAE